MSALRHATISCMKLDRMLRQMLYDVRSPWFRKTNHFLAFVTLVSILGVILETVSSLNVYKSVFWYVEWISVAIFTVEYFSRIYVNRKQPFKYIFSFFGVVDLLAILPTYLALPNLIFLKAARVLRILSFLKMIRLAKVSRVYEKDLRELEDYSHFYKLNIRIYFFALFSSVTIFGTLAYVAEGDIQDPLSSIPLGMIWAAKLTLGGMAQHLPQTVMGDLIAIMTRFTGLALMGLLVALFGNTIRGFLFGSEEVEQAKKSPKTTRRRKRQYH